MSQNTRLTKSKFKIALECPTQLYYHQNPELFYNQSDDNTFIESLAKGGFQVGEIAKNDKQNAVKLVESQIKNVLQEQLAKKDQELWTSKSKKR